MYTDWSEFPHDDELLIHDNYGESFHILSATYTYCSDEVKSLPMRSRNCYFDNEYHLDHFWNYHNSDCTHLCYANAVKQSCNCTPVFIPHIKRNPCKLVNIPCSVAVRWNTSNWLTFEKCPCLRDCESRKYRSQVTLGNFRAVPYAINNPYKGLVLNNTTSALRFFFTNPVFLKQKQETVMSIISLASNLGGVFGLSMGFSCISLLEILFYIYLGLRNYIKNRLNIN
ncbi:sodium channel protein Nach-like [Spodoptera frugiperda]|uniref:Sodium channel protein Nach-like n=1 Tax=Spodoptera frugiperda TaxID=7108 RepID=A0A9R0DR11_SPOFR|nr:sodium channel protein Nach-like [Spodoptera frugiperda]